MLNLTATVGERWRRGIERLRRPEDLGRWLVEASLVAEVPAVSSRQLRAARELREALYRLATAVRTNAPADEADVATVNAWAAKRLPAPQLALEGPAVTAQEPTAGVDSSLVKLAREGVELLGGSAAARVRECAADECALLFIDNSRGRSRRWCSMDDCGVRAKMATYRARRSDPARR